MLYALLCYHSEDAVFSWTKEQDDAVLAKLAVVQERLTKAAKLGPVARLMPTTAATTLRTRMNRTAAKKLTWCCRMKPPPFVVKGRPGDLGNKFRVRV